MAWTNEDGLYVRFGTERAEQAKVAEYTTDGPKRFVEILVNLTTLPLDADGVVRVSEEFVFPIGALIEAVEVITDVAFDSSGDGWVLDLGFEDMDGTNDDVDDLIDAMTQAEAITGGTNIAGWVGATVGTVTTKLQRLIWEVTVADATAGSGAIRVYYSFPDVQTDTLVQS